MKRPRFERPGLCVEAQRDGEGWCFVVYQRQTSVFIRSVKEVVRWISWPKGTPTRMALDAWLAELADHEKPVGDSHAELLIAEELKATGFGPEQHLDENDPNHNTRTVI